MRNSSCNTNTGGGRDSDIESKPEQAHTVGKKPM